MSGVPPEGVVKTSLARPKFSGNVRGPPGGCGEDLIGSAKILPGNLMEPPKIAKLKLKYRQVEVQVEVEVSPS